MPQPPLVRWSQRRSRGRSRCIARGVDVSRFSTRPEVTLDTFSSSSRFFPSRGGGLALSRETPSRGRLIRASRVLAIPARFRQHLALNHRPYGSAPSPPCPSWGGKNASGMGKEEACFWKQRRREEKEGSFSGEICDSRTLDDQHRRSRSGLT